MQICFLRSLSLAIAVSTLCPFQAALAQIPKVEGPEGVNRDSRNDVDLSYSEIRLPKGRPHDFVFSPDGTKIAIGIGSRIVIIGLFGQKEILQMQLPQADTWHRLSFSADAKILLWIGQDDDTVREFSLSTGKQIREFQLPGASSVRSVSTDATHIIYSEKNGLLKVSDIGSNKVIASIPNAPSYYASFTPDGKRFAVRDADNRLCFYETRTGKLVQELREPDPRREVSGFEFLTFAPDGAFVATWGRKNFLDIWDISSGKRIRTIAIRHWYHAGQFSRDGQSVLCWNSSNEAVLHSLLLEKVVFRIVSPRPYSAAMSPDEKKIVILSDSSVRSDYQYSLFIADLPAAFRAPSEARVIDDVEPSKLWDELKSHNDLRFQLALKAFRSAPKQAVDVIRKELRPATEAKQKQVESWIAEMDDDSPHRRDLAMEHLHGVAHEYSPLLIARQKNAGPGEVRNRLTLVLKQMNSEATPMALLRESRAVDLLEQLATPDAWHLVSELAGGAEHARLTVYARAALARKMN